MDKLGTILKDLQSVPKDSSACACAYCKHVYFCHDGQEDDLGLVQDYMSVDNPASANWIRCERCREKMEALEDAEGNDGVCGADGRNKGPCY